MDNSSSFKGAVKRSVVGIVDIFTTRLNLFFLELTEETQRILKAILMGAIALLFVFILVLLLTFGLIAFTWDTQYSVWVFTGLSLFYLLLTVFFAYQSIRLINSKSMFADTADVLEKDKDALTQLFVDDQ